MRCSKRIYYKTLHSTGAKVLKYSNTQILSDTESEQSEASELDQSFGDSVYESPVETDSELLADVNEISSRLSSVCIKGSNIFNEHCKNEITLELDQNNSISPAGEQTLIPEAFSFSLSPIQENGTHNQNLIQEHFNQSVVQDTINSNLSEDTLIQYTAEEMLVRQAEVLLAAQQTVAEDIDD